MHIEYSMKKNITMCNCQLDKWEKAPTNGKAIFHMNAWNSENVFVEDW